MNFEDYINFAGPEWGAFKQWLSKQREVQVNSLIGSRTQEDSDKRRGAISMIDQILALENSRSMSRT